ncbi:MAG: virulence RhuM family protein [Neisseriaceae bacterium]|nr:virulence RhuM family protein [Neisseriaceae bacterium]
MSNHIKSDFYLFSSADGKISVDVRFDGESVWLSLEQMANLFERDKSTVSRHIKNVFSENELDENSVVANFATTARDGKTYQVEHFNLDVIISVGYRVKSLRGTQFRQWATKRLNEYIRKGFTLDDERLKNGGGRYFKELLQRIRDIRSSERNLYQQVTDIFATSIDYDKNSPLTKNFFATVQNKLHFAAHNHTAAEIIFQRANQNQPLMGMTNFSGNYITKSDVGIAKNYLNEKELKILNLLVSRFLDYAELQALEEKTMTMQNWTDELDRQILNDNRQLLTDKGTISHKQAIEKAEKEFIAYRQKEMQQLESDFDKAMKKIVKNR